MLFLLAVVGRGAVGLFLRAAAGLVRRLGRAVPADLRRPAVRGPADRSTNGRAAPAGPGLGQARGRCAQPVRVRPRTVGGVAARTDRGLGRRLRACHLRLALRAVHPGPGRPPEAGLAGGRRHAEPGNRACQLGQ
ncbi:hypothetical protein G6F59_015430 [Rhizopus arrhizus]|nr:hypothetical protein G6F59_015430 [Rhizopus arrhizus]